MPSRSIFLFCVTSVTVMIVEAKITGIKYKTFLQKTLETITLSEFNINSAPSSCVVTEKNNSFAISKWVSPKRTRSYPYERVYDTLTFSKKITVIPVVKDEGIGGDRDFIQWDTVSLMSLLDVYVIPAYYCNAQKHRTRKNKITNQEFDNAYIISKIKEISNYHSSALHWNLKEMGENLSALFDKAMNSYNRISKQHKIHFHSEKGIKNLINKIQYAVDSFIDESRKKAAEAQQRERKTLQPKENLRSNSKSQITISNYLGGKYFLTSDETIITQQSLSLIESKHTKSAIIPSISDIKDGILKMILFCNLTEIQANGRKTILHPILKLTSPNITNAIDSSIGEKKLQTFFQHHHFSEQQMRLVLNLFTEANYNNFIVKIEKSR